MRYVLSQPRLDEPYVRYFRFLVCVWAEQLATPVDPLFLSLPFLESARRRCYITRQYATTHPRTRIPPSPSALLWGRSPHVWAIQEENMAAGSALRKACSELEFLGARCHIFLLDDREVLPRSRSLARQQRTPIHPITLRLFRGAPPPGFPAPRTSPSCFISSERARERESERARAREPQPPPP